MRPGETYYGADHLPRRRGGAAPVRPSWNTERPTNRRAVDDIPTPHLRTALEAKGLGPTVVDALVKDRDTNGGRWRITQELGL